jgi:hypothetical protein
MGFHEILIDSYSATCKAVTSAANPEGCSDSGRVTTGAANPLRGNIEFRQETLHGLAKVEALKQR